MFRSSNIIKQILIEHNFSGNYLYDREKEQKYKHIVELVVPNILIEDDCRSIGGKWQMCITYVNPEVKNKVNSIAVKEFGVINDLPLLISDLLDCNKTNK